MIADNDGVNAVWTRTVTANHQFLSAIHAILNPRATSFSRLVRAVFPLSDNALKLPLSRTTARSSVAPASTYSEILILLSWIITSDFSNTLLALDQWKASQITTIAAREIENAVVYARGFGTEIL